jgi:MFS transporter, DHA1 family, multidrug resistance protein
MTPNKSTISLKILMPLLAAIMAMSPLAVDLYLPAMPQLASALNTNISLVQNTLSIYLLGYAIGLIFFGPLADKSNRRTLVVIGISGFIIASIALAFSQNIEQFLALRFLQAIVSSAAIVVVPSTIREYYGKNIAKGLSYVTMIMMLAPLVAPSIGSALLLLGNWPLIFYCIAGYALVVLIAALKYLPERRSQAATTTSYSFFTRYAIVLGHQKARLDLISSMMVSLAFFAYLTAIPFVYLTVFKVSEVEFSVLFALNVGALMSAHFINTRLINRKGSRAMLKAGLVVALLAVIGLVFVNLLQLPLVYTVLTIFPLMGSISMIAVNSDALVLTEFAEHSGTATAVIGTLRFGIGALAGPILSYFYDGSALPFSLLMLAAILMIAICQSLQKTTNSVKN